MSQLAQRLFMASGGKKDSTYVDDVFSTYLYTGNQTSRTIDNGIKLSNANAGNSVQFVASSSQYLKVPQHSSLELGTGDYCIECWVRPTRSGSPNEGIWTYGSHDGNGGMLAWIHGNELKIFCARTNANICQVSNWRQQNVWTHLAVTRYSGTTKTFSNGVEIATSTEQNNDNVGEAANNMNQFFLGCERNNTNNIGGFFEGNISNMRIVKGSAVYTSNFTPPTKALTSTTNTLVLFCQSSTSATAATKTPIAITSSGDPTTIGFGPFTANDGKGGMVWTKARTGSSYTEHALEDTLRGVGKEVWSNSNAVETYHAERINSFNSSGYSMGTSQRYNQTGSDYVSWTFAKQEGFFDVVTWTGDNDANRQIPHNLGSIPGCIMVKCRNQDQMWSVYHRGVNQGINSEQYHMVLNNANDQDTTSDWNDTAPTSTHFTVSNGTRVNYVGYTYVAYVFAGGESTAATANSAYFDSSNINRLRLDDNDDWIFGDTFTLEAWIKLDSIPSSGYQHICAQSSNYGFYCTVENANKRVQFYDYHSSTTINSANNSLMAGQWIHIALVNNSGTAQWYINGVASGSSGSLDVDYDEASYFVIGGFASGSNPFGGYISNLRIVKGTAVYTSSFRPPTEPLTNITNTKLLCCQSSTVTTADVSPGTITNLGNGSNVTTASSDSPFDDPAGFKFGDSKEGIVKCGYYKTDSNEDAIIDLGWEPQWVLAKRIDANAGGDWMIYDSLRGLSNRPDVLRESGVSSALLVPNTTNAETNARRIGVYSRGFVQDAYGANREYIYIAIRRPDSFVGKPAEVGTDVFAMDAGAGSNSLPEFISNFPIDFVLRKNIIHAGSPWRAAARMMQGEFLEPTNTSSTSNSASLAAFDSNVGFCEDGADSNYQAWMFKRHAGFDFVMWKGQNVQPGVIPHSLGRVPEMMWLKNRGGGDWEVYHKYLNGGTNPETYSIKLNENDAEGNISRWYSTLPTSIDFTVTKNYFNASNEYYIAMLFASVDGISKVGGYTGDGAATKVITTGFQPRFIIIRRTASGGNWHVFDTVRGWTAGNDNQMALNNTAAQNNSYNYIGPPTSTGFSVSEPGGEMNMNGTDYIYYAHA